jgi:hypothetical protein
VDSTLFEDAVDDLDEFPLSGFAGQYPRRSQGVDESAKSGMRGLKRPELVEEHHRIPVGIFDVVTDNFFAKCRGRPGEVHDRYRIELLEFAEHLFECSPVHVQVYGVELFRQFSPIATGNDGRCSIVPNKLLKLVALMHGKANQL